MWSRNKPSDWLSTQSENDKSEISTGHKSLHQNI